MAEEFAFAGVFRHAVRGGKAFLLGPEFNGPGGAGDAFQVECQGVHHGFLGHRFAHLAQSGGVQVGDHPIQFAKELPGEALSRKVAEHAAVGGLNIDKSLAPSFVAVIHRIFT